MKINKYFQKKKIYIEKIIKKYEYLKIFKVMFKISKKYIYIKYKNIISETSYGIRFKYKRKKIIK